MYKDFYNIKLVRRLNIKTDNLDIFNNLPEIIKKIYFNRGINSIDDIYLNINNLLDYNLFKNINETINILVNSIYNNEKLIVVGDYDTDGVTSTALIIIALKSMGFYNIDFIIPNRFKDGHGLSKNIVDEVEFINGNIILTVDNGITSNDAVNYAKKKNIKVIITDHHIPIIPLPNADTIINPNLTGCKFSSKNISGVGISFYLMKALNDRLINLNWFSNKNIIIPNINDLLDLVAIGTIADMSYFDTNNRILVKYGIKIIKNKKCRLGLIKLIEYLNINIDNISILDINFYLIPCINSAGRIKDMYISMNLFLTDDVNKAIFISKELILLNSIRKKIYEKIENESIKLCYEYINKNNKFNSLIIYNSKFHNGLLGIIASKIKIKFNKPIIVFSDSNISNILIGSGRSIHEINIYEILKNINYLYPNLILKFGGHCNAIGLSINLLNLKKFIPIFENEVNSYIKKYKLIINNEKIIFSDGELSDNDITINNIKNINNNGPWGNGFPYPIFDGKFYLLNKKFFNKKNLKILVKSYNNGLIIEGLFFNVNIDFWNNLKSNKLILAYKLCLYKGIIKNKSNIQILIEYAWEI